METRKRFVSYQLPVEEVIDPKVFEQLAGRYNFSDAAEKAASGGAFC